VGGSGTEGWDHQTTAGNPGFTGSDPHCGDHFITMMRERRLEVADVFRTYEKEFFAQWGHVIGAHQRKAFEAIRDCRTAALGGHVEYMEQCDTCGHRVISYNWCRDRHCPKCQAIARAKWLAEREGELLPVPYFHVVFTLPQKIGVVALQNGREIYRILFRAASETLLTIAADTRRLGAAIGFRGCTAHLGAESPLASSPALRGSRRRRQPGRPSLDRM